MESNNESVVMKLTSAKNGEEIYYNIRHIDSYKECKEGTEILSSNSVTLVKESTEEILNKLIKYFRYKK